MQGKYTDFDLAEMELRSMSYEEEPNGVFDSLFDAYQCCPECDYEGPLDLKEEGYLCPDCRALVLPN